MTTFPKSGVSVQTQIRLFTLELSNQRAALKGQMEDKLKPSNDRQSWKCKCLSNPYSQHR